MTTRSGFRDFERARVTDDARANSATTRSVGRLRVERARDPPACARIFYMARLEVLYGISVRIRTARVPMYADDEKASDALSR